jgi:hypothetical protein
MNDRSKPIILPPYDRKDDDSVIKFLQRKYKNAIPLEKLINVSAFFLNKPYILGALGEGDKGHFDQSPLYRTDGFDCVTFVNTILALTLTQTLDAFKTQLIALNYLKNTVAYQNRCHFISLDWNQHNSLDNKILEDITHIIKDSDQQPLAKTAKAIIDKNQFFQHRTLNDIKLINPISFGDAQTMLNKLQHLATDIKPQMTNIDYLPLERLFDCNKKLNSNVLKQFPKVFILEIIRPNWDLTQKIGTHLHVSHLGFCFKNENTWIFRHASSQYKKVMDVPLDIYLNQYLNHETLKGINVQKIKPQSLHKLSLNYVLLKIDAD